MFKQTAATSFTYIGQAGGDAHQPRPAAIGSNKVGAQIAFVLAIVVAPPTLGQRLRCGCVDLLLHYPVLKENTDTHTHTCNDDHSCVCSTVKYPVNKASPLLPLNYFPNNFSVYTKIVIKLLDIIWVAINII